MKTVERAYSALQTFLLTPKTRAFLLLHDPQALKQATDTVRELQESGAFSPWGEVHEQTFKEIVTRELVLQSRAALAQKEPHVKFRIKQAFAELGEFLPREFL